jgi:hypothetical protein
VRAQNNTVPLVWLVEHAPGQVLKSPSFAYEKEGLDVELIKDTLAAN